MIVKSKRGTHQITWTDSENCVCSSGRFPARFRHVTHTYKQSHISKMYFNSLVVQVSTNKKSVCTYKNEKKKGLRVR